MSYVCCIYTTCMYKASKQSNGYKNQRYNLSLKTNDGCCLDKNLIVFGKKYNVNVQYNKK